MPGHRRRKRDISQNASICAVILKGYPLGDMTEIDHGEMRCARYADAGSWLQPRSVQCLRADDDNIFVTICAFVSTSSLPTQRTASLKGERLCVRDESQWTGRREEPLRPEDGLAASLARPLGPFSTMQAAHMHTERGNMEGEGTETLHECAHLLVLKLDEERVVLHDLVALVLARVEQLWEGEPLPGHLVAVVRVDELVVVHAVRGVPLDAAAGVLARVEGDDVVEQSLSLMDLDGSGL